MNDDDAPLLWHCPHCDDAMPLRQVWKHVNRTHHECLSCQSEVLIAAMLMQGRGSIVRLPGGPRGFP